MIGVLSLQGDFAEHIAAVEKAGQKAFEVRTIADLDRTNFLIMPGGESTTIGKLLELTGLDSEIKKRVAAGTLKVWGTCAGAILVANEVITDNPVNQLRLGDYSIARNAYGNQLDSFETVIDFEGIKVDCAFIRAPKILAVGADFEVIGEYQGQPVFIKNDKLLVSTCHPELYENLEFYNWLKVWIGKEL
jgi:5'-phosphate synthase pdxT subunit